MSQLSQTQIEAIKRLAKKFEVASVKIFGSVARGEAGRNSDLDILVRFERPISLVHIVGFKQALESALKMKVDVVEEGGISPFLKDRILAEAIPL
jgi:predicted nucleotidyltransferase